MLAFVKRSKTGLFIPLSAVSFDILCGFAQFVVALALAF